MKKLFTFLTVTALVALPTIASAHPGHDHSDGFHERSTAAIVAIILALLIIGILVVTRRTERSQDK